MLILTSRFSSSFLDLALTTRFDRHRWKEAIAYRRVSTNGQGASGVGLEGQQASIEEYARLDKFRITDWFDDVGTGRGRRNFVDRPGLQKAIEVARETGQPIIVNDLSRISRDAATVDKIIHEKGVTIISTGDGKLRNPSIVASEAARAQKEGEIISQRTKEALARKKAEGARLGNRTNLPDAQRKAVARRKEIAASTIDDIVTVLEDLDGKELTARQLAEELNGRGILTSTKRRWTMQALRRPMRRAQAVLAQRRQEEAYRTYRDHPLFGRF